MSYVAVLLCLAILRQVNYSSAYYGNTAKQYAYGNGGGSSCYGERTVTHLQTLTSTETKTTIATVTNFATTTAISTLTTTKTVSAEPVTKTVQQIITSTVLKKEIVTEVHGGNGGYGSYGHYGKPRYPYKISYPSW
ncbi:hypothetical protein SK128_019752 [Halocaridina rubra]|uniref:Uncharacterized protein n=1 Tax=Halocaridina rubra TaxID=373956 RepID=A0AAN9A7R7_HALRR